MFGLGALWNGWVDSIWIRVENVRIALLDSLKLRTNHRRRSGLDMIMGLAGQMREDSVRMVTEVSAHETYIALQIHPRQPHSFAFSSCVQTRLSCHLTQKTFTVPIHKVIRAHGRETRDNFPLD